MAGTPIVSAKEMVGTVRPKAQDQLQQLYPVEVLLGDREAEDETQERLPGEQVQQWSELADKYEELGKKVEEYLDVKKETEKDGPGSPPQPCICH